MTTATPVLDEIDKIMNEIEELQKSMNPPGAPSAPPAAVVSPPVPATAPAAIDDIDAIMAAHAPTEAVAEVVADEAMAEIQEGRTETSIEETLGSLKDEEPSAGPNLIDQAIEAQPDEAQPEVEAQAVQDQVEAIQAQPVSSFSPEVFDEAIEAVIEPVEPVAAQPQATVHHLPRSAPIQETTPMKENTSSDASISVKLSGTMTLKLSYEFEGQEVTVSFNDGALRVELSDGTEFKIPVRRNSLRKTA
ncbi:hypothetical protein WDW37_08260 [Bdellovibrionota bacterium FG-1]